MLKRSKRIDPLPRWKRCFDLSGATLALIILSPLMCLVSIYIKLASRGPVFFKHKRYGFQGEPLYVWKFRSMHTHADPGDHQNYVMNIRQDDQQLTKLNTDAQLIPMGKLLRSTALDELPQLFNVLKGEMSLVGPRPDVIPLDGYLDWQKIRFDVLPGLTGLWQVSGKNNTTFLEMNQLDADYVHRRSFWFDLKIILYTIPAIFGQVSDDFDSRNKS